MNRSLGRSDGKLNNLGKLIRGDTDDNRNKSIIINADEKKEKEKGAKTPPPPQPPSTPATPPTAAPKDKKKGVQPPPPTSPPQPPQPTQPPQPPQAPPTPATPPTPAPKDNKKGVQPPPPPAPKPDKKRGKILDKYGKLNVVNLDEIKYLKDMAEQPQVIKKEEEKYVDICRYDDIIGDNKFIKYNKLKNMEKERLNRLFNGGLNGRMFIRLCEDDKVRLEKENRLKYGDNVEKYEIWGIMRMAASPQNINWEKLGDKKDIDINNGEIGLGEFEKFGGYRL